MSLLCFVFFFLLSAVEGKEQGVQGNLCVNSPEVESSVEEDYEALWPFCWLPEFWQGLWPTVLPDRNFHSALRGNARRLEGGKNSKLKINGSFLFSCFLACFCCRSRQNNFGTHTHTDAHFLHSCRWRESPVTSAVMTARQTLTPHAQRQQRPDRSPRPRTATIQHQRG